jgi:hypothetical protein
MTRGAFAVIYGIYLKYYIKDPEVNSRNALSVNICRIYYIEKGMAQECPIL